MFQLCLCSFHGSAVLLHAGLSWAWPALCVQNGSTAGGLTHTSSSGPGTWPGHTVRGMEPSIPALSTEEEGVACPDWWWVVLPSPLLSGEEVAFRR